MSIPSRHAYAALRRALGRQVRQCGFVLAHTASRFLRERRNDDDTTTTTTTTMSGEQAMSEPGMAEWGNNGSQVLEALFLGL